jgi:hypothetical protein
LLFPRSPLALLALALSYIVFSRDFAGGNHVVFALFVNCVLILSYLWLALKTKTLRISSVRIVDRAAPTIRVLVLLLYFFAVLSKLNWDYLNPDFSCASWIYQLWTDRIHLLPKGDVVGKLAILLSLSAEISIPILLSIPRTRRVGVLFGIAFHFLLGAFPPQMFNWSATLFATFVLFLEPKSEGVKKIEEPESSSTVLFKLTVLYAVVTILQIIWATEISSSIRAFAKVAFILYAIGVIIAVWHRRPISEISGKFDLITTVICSVFILHCASGYFGWPRGGKMEMYSNLNVTKFSSNHILIPPLGEPLPLLAERSGARCKPN